MLEDQLLIEFADRVAARVDYEFGQVSRGWKNVWLQYQFNKHFRVRLLEQFDSSQRQLLTDLHAMYEPVPGTVFNAGYGSLYERQSPPQPGAAPAPGTFGDGYLTVSRGLFFKASYLYRF